MPTILRNPFRKQDENLRPSQQANAIEQRVNGTGNAKTVDAPQVKESTEYKLSEINDSGVYLPPSPTERKSFWSTTSSRSTTSTNRPSLISDNDQFSISRESFDSYRRSFDISARSPIINGSDTSRPPRASLDSRTFYPPPRASFESRGNASLQAPPPRSSNSFTRPSQVPAETREEREPTSSGQQEFEDVDIADRPMTGAQPGGKRGLFSRITGYGDHAERPSSADGKSWHHFGGRRRGQSGQGAELGAIPIKKEDGVARGESQLKKDNPAKREPPNTPDKAAQDTTPKPAKRDPVKVDEEAQAVQGASSNDSTGESPVDSGVDVEGMKNVSLDDAPPEVTTKAATTGSSSDDQGLKALKPQTAQAPEIKSDS